MGDLETRIHDVAAILEDLRALLDEEPLDQVLDRLAHSAARTVPGAAGVSITVLSDERTAHTAAATDQTVVDIDARQYAAGEGPCLKAARDRRPVRVDIGEIRHRWAPFADAAAQAGMRCYLSAPLLLDSEAPVLGALNMYGREPGTFDSLDEAVLTLFTTVVSTAIVTARRYRRAEELAHNLAEALNSRAQIEQAKGVLMARHKIAAEQAFDHLARESQNSNTKLRDVARSLLESAVEHPEAGRT